ncbi:MAG: DM13 domain-containing protein [Planctomycetes bacterium]|nr:DM13 domain-containing protein [Planctomycetota bacterium]
MRGYHLGLYILASVLIAHVAQAADVYPRAGWKAEITNGDHQVQAVATIIDEQSVQVEHFTYDGTEPLVYFYLGGNNSNEAFLMGLPLPPPLDRAYVDELLVLTLPDGETLDKYTALAVWDASGNENFGSAVFKIDDPNDADDDGDIDGDDYAMFWDCLSGPNIAPVPTTVSVEQCLISFDRDSDGDVDTSDFDDFQAIFTGPPPTSVRYEVVFDASWSAATHPQIFPNNPHFSGLIGGTHDNGVRFWEPGGIASQGIKDMAELGNKAALRGEVEAAIGTGHAGQVISGPNINPSPGSSRATFTLTQTFPLATVTSMVAPSPDWFVAVSGLALFTDNQWTPEIAIRLDPYDAGTDSGTNYSSANQATDPQEPIQLIVGFPFLNGEQQLPLGTFTFRMIE